MLLGNHQTTSLDVLAIDTPEVLHSMMPEHRQPGTLATANVQDALRSDQFHDIRDHGLGGVQRAKGDFVEESPIVNRGFGRRTHSAQIEFSVPPQK
jgi:hypothetical protein